MEQKVLTFCKSPKSIQEVISHLGYKDRTKFRSKYINPLIDNEWLVMPDPGSPKSPKQQYQTTELGKKQLKEEQNTHFGQCVRQDIGYSNRTYDYNGYYWRLSPIQPAQVESETPLILRVLNRVSPPRRIK